MNLFKALTILLLIFAMPACTTPSTDSYVLLDLEIHYAHDYVYIAMKGESGEVEQFSITGPEGVALIAALRKSDEAIKNLQRYALRYLVNNGHLVVEGR